MTKAVCAIVGAGEGLGRALAAKFASEGYALALVSRSEEGSRAAMEAGQEAGVDVAFEAGDAERPESVEAALQRLSEALDHPQVMIYNVRGAFDRVQPLEIEYEALEAVLRLEVGGALAAAKAVLPAMRARGSGTLLYSSATAAFRGSASHALYAIGKFGLRGLAQSLAKAYAADGIHVAHLRLDCDLDVPMMQELYGEKAGPETLADPDAVAETYWWVHQQPKAAWSNEVEVRPYFESWTI